MKDPQRVQEILESMVKAGSNTVQVTSQLVNGLSYDIQMFLCLHSTPNELNFDLNDW